MRLKNKKKEGKNFSYTLGEHMIKFLLGPIAEFTERKKTSYIDCKIL